MTEYTSDDYDSDDDDYDSDGNINNDPTMIKNVEFVIYFRNIMTDMKSLKRINVYYDNKLCGMCMIDHYGLDFYTTANGDVNSYIIPNYKKMILHCLIPKFRLYNYEGFTFTANVSDFLCILTE